MTDFIPYGRQSITQGDIDAVVEVLQSDWLTTGPKLGEFEKALAEYVDAEYAVVFSSGTGALHAAAFAAGIGSGDEAITTPLTFCATSNCVIYQGGKPVFADIEPDTLTLNPAKAEEKITARTKAILPVDYAGHPADLDEFMALAQKHNLIVIEDACHALGARYKVKAKDEVKKRTAGEHNNEIKESHSVSKDLNQSDTANRPQSQSISTNINQFQPSKQPQPKPESAWRRVGGISHMTVFSFHPIKHITTGEGGVVTTNSMELYKKLKLFRNHGISSEARERMEAGNWYYEMTALGYNYRLSDIGCALGLSQLQRINENLSRRNAIAEQYDQAFSASHLLQTPVTLPHAYHAWHLYPLRIDFSRLGISRKELFVSLKTDNIGVNVHYIPVHTHPYYRERYGYEGGEFPVAEEAYEQLISLPMYHSMSNEQVERVIKAVRVLF